MGAFVEDNVVPIELAATDDIEKLPELPELDEIDGLRGAVVTKST